MRHRRMRDEEGHALSQGISLSIVERVACFVARRWRPPPFAILPCHLGYIHPSYATTLLLSIPLTEGEAGQERVKGGGRVAGYAR